MSKPTPDSPEKSLRPTVTLVRKSRIAAPDSSTSAASPAPRAASGPVSHMPAPPASSHPSSATIAAADGVSAPGAPELGSLEPADASVTIVPRAPFVGERFCSLLTRPAVCVTTIIVSVALLGWTFLVRWPNRPIGVQARPMPALVAPDGSGPTPSAEQMVSLREVGALAATQVVTNREELPALIASIEQEARAAGFVTELTVRLPFSPVPGVPDLLRHPIGLRMENDYDRTEPVYTRLLGWMRRISSLGVKAEFTAISLQSLGDGVASANVELHLMSLPASFDAKAPPE